MVCIRPTTGHTTATTTTTHHPKLYIAEHNVLMLKSNWIFWKWSYCVCERQMMMLNCWKRFWASNCWPYAPSRLIPKWKKIGDWLSLSLIFVASSVSYIVCPRNGWLTYPIQRSDAERKKIQKKIIVVESSECACVCVRGSRQWAHPMWILAMTSEAIWSRTTTTFCQRRHKNKSSFLVHLFNYCKAVGHSVACRCECRTWTTDACALNLRIE